MSEQHSNQLTGHNYDGIQEFDNPTPGWWHMIFAMTIVFSVCYLLFWHFSEFGWAVEDSWNADQKAEFVHIFGSIGTMEPDEKTILTQMHNPQMMAIAQSTFAGNCSACHARDGGGLVGVNLCDDSYKNVTKIEDIYRVISEGANNGAMPSWKNRFSVNERIILASYVASLRGTTPAAPKSPEGNRILPWPPAPATALEVKPAAAKPGSK